MKRVVPIMLLAATAAGPPPAGGAGSNPTETPTPKTVPGSSDKVPPYWPPVTYRIDAQHTMEPNMASLATFGDWNLKTDPADPDATGEVSSSQIGALTKVVIRFTPHAKPYAMDCVVAFSKPIRWTFSAVWFAPPPGADTSTLVTLPPDGHFKLTVPPTTTPNALQILRASNEPDKFYQTLSFRGCKFTVKN